MKRFISLSLVLILALSMCICLTSCKEKESQPDTKKAENISELTEQDIRILMEKNLDCYFLFYVAPLNHTTQQNSDGYYGADTSYLQNYDELKDLVEATYASEKANELLNYPSVDEPLYKNVDGSIFVNPSVISPVDYEIIWDDNYDIEMEKISDSEYNLTLTTTDFELETYATDGKIVFENGKWRFADLIY